MVAAYSRQRQQCGLARPDGGRWLAGRLEVWNPSYCSILRLTTVVRYFDSMPPMVLLLCACAEVAWRRMLAGVAM
jgi:hypothetical protein